MKLKDIKPALSGYIREAQILLNLNPVPDERVVHDVRVLMKKSRAVMRLLAKQVDEDFFEKEYGTYREIGNIMSSWRDNSVYRKIIKDLKKNKPVSFPN
jgi:CHAD domain-containing protein